MDAPEARVQCCGVQRAQAGLLVLAWSCSAGPPLLLIGARQPYPRWAQCATSPPHPPAEPAVLWFCEAKSGQHRRGFRDQDRL
ncbi:unnamed protein product [Arctogadus glacialis]